MALDFMHYCKSIDDFMIWTDSIFERDQRYHRIIINNFPQKSAVVDNVYFYSFIDGRHKIPEQHSNEQLIELLTLAKHFITQYNSAVPNPIMIVVCENTDFSKNYQGLVKWEKEMTPDIINELFTELVLTYS